MMVTLPSTLTFPWMYMPAGPSEGPPTATTPGVVSLSLGPMGDSEVRFRLRLPLPRVAEAGAFQKSKVLQIVD